MATNYPASLDNGTSLPYPTATSARNAPSLAGLQDNQNDAVIAAQTKLGTGASTPTNNNLLIGTGTGTSAWTKAAPTGTIVGTTDSQVLTNKTLTSPVINTPNISNATITSDSYAGFTSTNTGSIYGVSVVNSAFPTLNATNITATSITTGSLNIANQTSSADWSLLAGTANTVVANGNRSYTLTINSVDYTGTLNPGTRIRTTRTVAAPTQCTSLNGTTQYYSKASPAGFTFTNNFVVAGAIKPSSYALGTIASVYNGTSGFALRQLATGQIEMSCYNAGAANFFKFTSSQSVALNKWGNGVVCQVDMTVTTNTPTTNYIMIDGVDVPGTATRGGTNPTAIPSMAGIALNVGAENGGTNPFPGKLAQVAFFNAKVTQATMLSYLSQTLAGSETSLISAYSFNNVITDLNTTNANNLTANGSAVATNADSPFGGQASGTISSTYDYGIVQSATFSTNTTVVVQVSEGNTIPSSGGVTAIHYSSAKAPYGFPATNNKWELLTLNNTDNTQASPSTTVYNLGSVRLNLPIGYWNLGYNVAFYGSITSGVCAVQAGLSTSSSAFSDLTFKSYAEGPTGNLAVSGFGTRDQNITLSSATNYYLNTANYSGTTPTSIYNFGSRAATQIRAIPSNL